MANNLGKVKLENINEESIESLVFTGNVNTDKRKSTDLGKVVSSIDNIIEELHILLILTKNFLHIKKVLNVLKIVLLI